MNALIKKASMDVLFEDRGNISNITISIEPEAATLLHVGDEIVFTPESFPQDMNNLIWTDNLQAATEASFSINYYLLKNFMQYYLTIYPTERRMYLMIERKIYTCGEYVYFIAKVRSPKEAKE